MDAKISGEFWSDPAIEGLTMEQRMAALWAITSNRTNIIGYVEVSPKRFEFETGCPYEALLTLCDAHSKGFKRCGSGVWIRSFIAHQIGRGIPLVKNMMTRSLLRELRAWHGDELAEYVLTEYPELKSEYESSNDALYTPVSGGDAIPKSRVEKSRVEKSTPDDDENSSEAPAVSEILQRVRDLFRIRPSTPLDSGQITAWKKNKGAVEATPEEDWRAMEWWFQQPNDKNDLAEYRRTTLGALLNHWSDEIVKARRAGAKSGASFIPQKKKKAAEIPEDWQGMLTEMDPEFNAPDRFEDLPESIREMLMYEWRKNREGGNGQ